MNTKTLTFRLAALAALGTAALSAQAQALVNARVLSSAPITEAVAVQDCGGANPGAVRPSGAGTAVGALVGGLLGSQLGRGSGHIAGAILGTVGGAMVGNAAETQNGYVGCGTRTVSRVTGYDVTYELDGRTYRTRTPQPPGQWLQVAAPAGYGAAQTYPVAPAYDNTQGYAAPPQPAYAQPYPPQGYPQQEAYPQQVYPQAYPQAYSPQPVYVAPQPVYVQPAPVYYTRPVGVSLSIGGGFGGRHFGGWGVGLGF